MLAEFNSLNTAYGDTVKWRDERFKGFINIVFGMVALLALIAQVFGTGTILIYTAIIISSILYFYGIQVYIQLVHGDKSIDKYKRSIKLVRGYFVKLDEKLQENLMLSFLREKDSGNAKPTPKKFMTSLLDTTILTNSIILIIGLMLLGVNILGFSVILVIPTTAFFVIINLVLSKIYYDHVMRK